MTKYFEARLTEIASVNFVEYDFFSFQTLIKEKEMNALRSERSFL